MRKLLAACALAGLALGQGSAHAQDVAPRVFKQDGAWALDYGDDYCRLAGNFTNGPDRIALAMERIEPGNFMRVALVGNAIKLFRRANEIGLQFAPAGAERKLRYVQSEVAGGEQYLLIDHVTLAEPAPPVAGPSPVYDRAAEAALAKGITGLRLGSGLNAPIEVQTGPLAAPVKALQACADDMLKVWGLDPAGHKALTRSAAPAENPAGWLPQGTIAFADFAKLNGGANQLRVMIDATGKATDCKVHWATLDAGKNQQLCAAVLQHGKFTPALNAQGQGIASYAMLSPMFLMPPMKGRR